MSESDGTSVPKARLGVLFVHGIGDQPQGSTLVQFAEPIVHWMERCFAGLPKRLLRAGVTRTEINRWHEAVWNQWTAGREDLLHWKPLLWRFLSDNDFVLGSARTEIRSGKSLTGSQSEDSPVGPADIQKMEQRAAGLPAITAGVELEHGILRPGPDTPAHASLHISGVAADGTLSRTEWLLAESWWAGAFGVPTFRDLMGPSLKLVPAAVGLHFGTRLRRAWRKTRMPGKVLDYALRAGRVAFAVALLIAGLILAVAALAVLLLLYPLTLLPVARLRAMAAAVQRALTATLGDSYVLVTSPVRTAAILARLRKDIEWLATRCESIAIVAHSQGAALTHLLLQQAYSEITFKTGEKNARLPEWLEKLNLLLTFGSGLKKLAEMRRIRGEAGLHVTKFPALALLGPLALFSLIEAFRNGTADPMSLILYGGMLLMAGLAIYGLAHGTAASELEYWTKEFRDVLNLKWIDHYASADPVPNGQLLDQDYPRCVRVTNRGSTATDHTVYWQNGDEFVSSVVASLSQLEDGPLRSVLDFPEPHKERAAGLRRLRVRFLSAARWFTIAAAAVAAITHVQQWSILAEWTRQKIASWFVAVLPNELSWQVTVTARPTPATLAETAGWLIALAVAYHAVFLIWRWWEYQEMDLFFAHARPKDPSKRMMSFLAAGVAPLAFTLWLCLPDVFQQSSDRLLWPSLAVVIAGSGVYFFRAKRSAVLPRREAEAPQESAPAAKQTAASGEEQQ